MFNTLFLQVAVIYFFTTFLQCIAKHYFYYLQIFEKGLPEEGAETFAEGYHQLKIYCGAVIVTVSK